MSAHRRCCCPFDQQTQNDCKIRAQTSENAPQNNHPIDEVIFILF